ncbi:hypothetical protein M9H77_07655 [Catharanthus roseus]|uniref:Uncharacterized protein n=1 Tax=Catharanthus roseus TaxID=4058 RepID=A0ACC0BVL2_CATRO|nr:hypothetical protein M9H77_07655 [Catharanthus roseus]
MEYWESPEYKVFCERSKWNRNEGSGVGEPRSTQRFSKSTHLEELHKYQKEDKKGQYMDFQSNDSMRRVFEVVVSFVWFAFDEHMIQFAERSHLQYTTMPPMMDITRAAVAAVPWTKYSSTTKAARTLDVRVSSSILPTSLLMPQSPALLIPSPLPLLLPTL